MTNSCFPDPYLPFPLFSFLSSLSSVSLLFHSFENSPHQRSVRGIYDDEYMDYIVAIFRKCNSWMSDTKILYLSSWSRFSSGSNSERQPHAVWIHGIAQLCRLLLSTANTRLGGLHHLPDLAFGLTATNYDWLLPQTFLTILFPAIQKSQ